MSAASPPDERARAPADDPSTVGAFAILRAAPTDRPFVVAQIGQSLDGRIATRTGESRYINGDAALDHLHRLRAHVDAVVVGCETIRIDDPQLNVRRVPGRNPARVVIDPRGRLGSGHRWLARDNAPLYVITDGCESCCGAQLLRLPRDSSGGIPPAAILGALFGLGLRRILIEGGARTISGFIDAGCIDRLHILMAPVILGSGRAGLDLAPIETLRDAIRPTVHPYALGGGEVLFDCAFD